MLLLSNTYRLDAAHDLVNPWPDRRQTLLLRVALSAPDLARDSWRLWNRDFVLENDVDPGSFVLMGLVYRRVQELQLPASSDMLGRLRGLYRYLWSENQSNMNSSRETIGVLPAAGLPILLNRGLPLVELYYRDWGLRRTTDRSVLLHPSLMEQAHKVLQLQGWRGNRYPDERVLNTFQSSVYRKASQVELALQWRPYLLDTAKIHTDQFWNRAVTHTIQGWSVLVPDATDLLIETCLQGRKQAPATITQWVADAAVLMRARTPLDGTELRRRATDYGLQHLIDDSLRYLHDEYGIGASSKAFTRISPARMPVQNRILWTVQFLHHRLERACETRARIKRASRKLRQVLLLIQQALQYLITYRRQQVAITGRGFLKHLACVRRELQPME